MLTRVLIKPVVVAAVCFGASIAQAEVVVIGNPAGPALTKDQVADVYLGKSQSATPVDQPESASIREDFYKKATGKDPAQVKALWSRLTFTGKAQPPKELADSVAVKKAVAADPKTIGYIDKSTVDASVKVLANID